MARLIASGSLSCDDGAVRRAPAHRALIPAWLGKWWYGALFTVALPLALAAWAVRLDRFIPISATALPWAGAILVLSGATLFAAAVLALWIDGRGLPMSAYPPAQFVATGVYRYVRNPMYIGAVLMCAGLAIGTGSASGLWIVSPVLAASAAVWVVGYERDATRARFGATVRDPVLRLPPADAVAPTAWDRFSVLVLVLLPWLVAYQAVEALGTPPHAVVAWRSWDAALPVVPWTEVVYALTYPFVLGVPFIAATRADVRWFMTRGWLATALIVPFYLLVPIVAPAKPVTGDGVLAVLLRSERAFDAPVTACPAFHVVWTALAAVVYARRWKGVTPLWWGTVAAIAVSCVTTGMHAALDIAGALIAVIAILHAESVWSVMRRWAERVANSWRELNLGPVRIINHGLYASVGACAGVIVAVMLAGPGQMWPIVGVAAAAIVGASLWAQLVEGSPQLLRPYGYFGSVGGAIVGLLVIQAFASEFWLPAAAFAVGAAFAQAIGRARCLVQGCCHGAPGPEWLGIRYVHPRSRVTRLSPLGGVALHPTPLYSALWMIAVGGILLRLWVLEAGLQFIAGAYFILTGLGRFVEEHYRGEPQTAVWCGLRLYQWLAIGFVIVGAAITAIGWTPTPGRVSPDAVSIPGIVAFGTGVYVAYGVDFPRLSARFSRLV